MSLLFVNQLFLLISDISQARRTGSVEVRGTHVYPSPYSLLADEMHPLYLLIYFVASKYIVSLHASGCYRSKAETTEFFLFPDACHFLPEQNQRKKNPHFTRITRALRCGHLPLLSLSVCFAIRTLSLRFENLLHNSEIQCIFVPIFKGAGLEQIFETLVQCIYSTPAFLFPCVLTCEIGFD